MLNKKKDSRKPKLTTLDSMFGLEEKTTDGSPLHIPIDDNLIPYREHPFSLYTGERLDDMSHTEKATVLGFQYSKIFSRGKRNDIQSELLALENHGQSTSGQVDQKQTSRDNLGKEYALSESTVARYLRVNELSEPLKRRLDNGEIAFMSAVSLSFLDDKGQEKVENSLKLNGFKLDMKKARMLRSHGEKETLTNDSIYLILNGEIKQKPINLTPPVRVKHKVYSKFFPPEMKESEIEKTIEKALILYFEKEKKQSKRKSKER